MGAGIADGEGDVDSKTRALSAFSFREPVIVSLELPPPRSKLIVAISYLKLAKANLPRRPDLPNPDSIPPRDTRDGAPL